MFLLGLLLALTSKAHTPMRPRGAGFAVFFFCQLGPARMSCAEVLTDPLPSPCGEVSGHYLDCGC